MMITVEAKNLLDELTDRWSDRDFETIEEIQALIDGITIELMSQPVMVDLCDNG